MITLRQAKLTDLDLILDLNTMIFMDNPKYDNDAIKNFAHTPLGRKYFKKAIKSKDGCFFVAEEDGKMIGYVNGGKMEVSYRKSKYFEIDNLGVIPNKKRLGIGKKLLDTVEKWVKENGYQKIYLNSYSKNRNALAFYRKFSYEDIDVCLEKEI